MPKGDAAKVKLALEGFSAFLEASGNITEKRKARIAKYVSQLDSEGLTKELGRKIEEYSDTVAHNVMTGIYNGACLHGKPGMETEEVMWRAFNKLVDGIRPPTPIAPELNLSPYLQRGLVFAGSEQNGHRKRAA